MPYHPDDIAKAAAQCPETVDRLFADGEIDLHTTMVKIDGQNVPVPLALHEAAIRMTQGRYPEAECIASDCIAAIAVALEPWSQEESKRLIALDIARADGDDYYDRDAA